MKAHFARGVAALLSLTMAMSSADLGVLTAWVASAAEEVTIASADVNGDGKVNEADSKAVLDCIGESVNTISAQRHANCDVYCDGKVDIRDVMAVEHAIAGKPATVPEKATNGSSTTLALSEVVGYAGEEAVVDLSLLDWNQDIDALELKLNFDDNLKLKTVDCSGELQYMVSDNTIKFYGMYTMKEAYRGLLASLTFQMPDNAYGDYGINMIDTGIYDSGFSAYSVIKNVGKISVDTVAKPLYVRAGELNSKSVKLTWSMPFDKDLLDGYIVYRDGEEIARTEEMFYDDKNLTTGTKYVYSVQAYGEDYLSSMSKTVTVVPKAPVITAVTFPDNADTVGGKFTQVTCDMEHAANLQSFALTYTASDGTKGTIYSGSYQSFYSMDMKWMLSELVSGKYTVTFHIMDADGAEDEKSTTINVDTTPPAEVFGFSVYEGEECNVLTWGVAEEAKVVGYNLYRRTATSNYTLLTYIDGREVLEYTDKNVVVGAEYSYMIAAVDHYGMEGIYSKEISASSRADETSPEITLFLPSSGTVLSHVVTLNVRATDNIGVSRLACFISEDDGETWKELFTANGTYANFRFDTSAYSLATVKIKAVAYDFAGNESSGANINIYAIDNQGPEQVTGVKLVSAGATIATLAWNDVADKDFSYFIVKYGITGEETINTLHVSTTLGVNLRNLLPAHSYTVTVAGCDIYGNIGADSEPFTFETIKDETAPWITSISPAPGYYANSLPLTVSARDDFAVKSITIEISADKETWTEVATVENTAENASMSAAATADLSGFADGTIYVRASAKDSAGNVTATEDMPINEYMVDHTAPAVMETLSVAEDVDCIELRWEAPEEEGISCFSLFRSTEENGEYTCIAKDIRSLNYFDRAVTAGVTYYYKVCAKDLAGNTGELSAAVSASKPADEVVPEICSFSPEAGSLLTANNKMIRVLAKDNLMLAGIKIEYKTEESATAYTTLYELTGLNSYYHIAEVSVPAKLMKNGTTLYLRACATDQSGNVSKYGYASYVVDDGSTPITSVQVEQTETSNLIKWEATETEQTSGYYIYRKIGSASYVCIGSVSANAKYAGSYTFTDNDLSTDGNYVYRIKSVNFNGNSATRTSAAVGVHTKPVAVISCEATMECGVEYIFDATGCTDFSGITEVLIDFGDGKQESVNAAANAKFVHKYAEAGLYTVTVTCTNEFGLQNSTTRTVAVSERVLMGQAKIKVKTTEGNNASNIAVYLDFGSDSQTKLVTNQYGEVTFTTTVGAHQIGVYGDGYLPQVKECLVVSGEENYFEFAVVEEFIVSAEFEVTRMTLDDIVAAGIDVTKPENQQIVKVQIDLQYKVVGKGGSGAINDSINMYVNSYTGKIVINNVSYVNNPTTGTRYSYTPVYVDYNSETNAVNTVVLMSIPVSASYLKEFFDVKMHIINNADKEFNISDSTVKLNLPEGLTLMTEAKDCDGMISHIDNIPGQSQETLEWIIRGDKAGKYQISADYTGTLDVFNETISTQFVCDEPIEVYGETAVDVSINIPRTIGNNRIFFEVAMKNNTEIPVYNLNTSVGEILAQVYGKNKTVKASVYQTRIIHPNGEIEVIEDAEKMEELKPGYTFSVVYLAQNLFSSQINPATGKYVNFGSETMALTSIAVKELVNSGIRVNVNIVDRISIVSTGDDGESVTPHVTKSDQLDEDTEYQINVYGGSCTVVSGATVTLSGGGKTYSGTTDADGQVILKRPDGDDWSLSVSSVSGYESYVDSSYCPRYCGFDSVTLVGVADASYKLKTATYKPFIGPSWNILVNAKAINETNDGDLDTFDIICASKKTDAKYYELWQGTRKIKTTYPADDNSGKFILLSQDDFTVEKKDVFIRVYMPNGAYVDTPINFMVKKDPRTNFKISFDGNTSGVSTFSIKFPDDLPFVGGMDCSLKLPNLVEAPYILDISNGKIRVGVNWSETEVGPFDFDKFKNTIKSNSIEDAIQNYTQGKAANFGGLKGTLSFMGYLEGTWDGGDKTSLTGCFYFSAGISGRYDFQFMVSIIPVTVYIKGDITAGAGVTGTISYDGSKDEDKQWSTKCTLYTTLSGSLEVFGGIGIAKCAGVGAYGKAVTSISGTLMSTEKPTGIDSIDLTGELGVKCYVGPFEYKKAFAYQTWNLYTSASSFDSGQPEGTKVSYLNALYNTENYTLMDPDQIADAVWVNQYDSASGLTTLQTGASYTASPSVASAEAGTVMTFLCNDKGRAVYDMSHLMFSVLDEKTGTWSEPASVDTNSTGDYAPKLVSDGTDLYLVYQESNTTFGGKKTLKIEDITQTLEIVVAKFDPATQTFTNFRTLTAGENTYNSQPAIYAAGGEVHVLWNANTTLDYFGCNATNSILTATYKDGAWSKPTEIATGLNAVTATACGMFGDTYTMAYVLDGDNDLTTLEDKTLYTFTEGAEKATSVAYGDLSNPIFTVMPDTTTNDLIWYEAGDAMRLTTGGEAASSLTGEKIAGLTDTFAVCGNKLVFAGADDAASNIFTMSYDAENKTWTSPVRATNQTAYLEHPAFVETVDGALLTVMLQNKVTVSENDVATETKLMSATLTTSRNLTLDKATFDYTQIVAGKALPLNLQVTNNGGEAVKNMTASLYDAAGELVAANTLETNLISGKSTDLETAFILPEDFVGGDYTVVIAQPDGADADAADNSTVLALGKTELSMDYIINYMGDEKTMTVSIKNESAVASGGVLNLYKQSNPDTPACSILVDEIAPGKTAKYDILLDSRLIDGNGSNITCTLTADREEYTDFGNTLIVYATQDVMLGDVTMNGVIDSDDAVRVMKFYAVSILGDKPDATAAQLAAADVNGDGVVDTSDAILILKFYANSMLDSSISFTDFLSKQLKKH